jgi:hypothetical protein
MASRSGSLKMGGEGKQAELFCKKARKKLYPLVVEAPGNEVFGFLLFTKRRLACFSRR